MEIYNDILNGIAEEHANGEVKPTKIAHHANMSYDKLTRYLEELQTKELITKTTLDVTDKGRKFLQDYDKINDFVVQMKLDYLESGSQN